MSAPGQIHGGVFTAMLERYWVAIFALGLALPAHSQEGVSIEGPAVEEGQPAQAGDGVSYSPPTPFPVVIVETPEQAAHAQESEQNAADHEAADLAAQRKAADAADRAAATAERQEIPAWVQIWLAIVSTIIALIALGFSIWSGYRSDKTARAQLRAYVLLEGIDLAEDEDGVTVFTANVRNSGQTPALELQYRLSVFTPEPDGDAVIDKTLPYATTDIGAGAIHPLRLRWAAFAGENQTAVLIGKTDAWFQGVVRYKDVFGIERFTWFKSRIHGEHHPTLVGKHILTLSPTSDGNHTT